jgi:uncharacterized RDD family membrane protein YckC
LSKCLKCGAELPPVGECTACAITLPGNSPVPSLLNKDIQIDRRTPERTPAVTVPEVPSFADIARGPAPVPPGMTPRGPQRTPTPLPMPQVQEAAPPRIPTPPAFPQIQAEEPTLPPSLPPRPGVPAAASLSQAPASDPDVTEPGQPVPAFAAPPAPSSMATAAMRDELPTPPAMPRSQPEATTPGDASRPVPTPVPVMTFTAPSRVSPPPSLSEPLASQDLTPRIPIPALRPQDPEASTLPPTGSAQAPSPPPSATTQPRPRVASPAARSTTGVQEIHARPASLWRRLLSFTIDTAAIVGVAALYITVASSITGVKTPSSQGLTLLDSIAAWMHALKSVLLPGVILMLVLAVTYCAVAAFLWNGRTLGRVVLGLRLVDTHGLAPAPTRAIVRALLSVVSFGLFLGGFWMALFDRRGQTLHDKLTSTFVVQPS